MKNIIFVCDLFLDEYVGGAELTTQAIIDSAPKNFQTLKIKSNLLTLELINKHINDIWVFGNISFIDVLLLIEISKKIKNYYVLEYDFKFCDFRSIIVHNKSGVTCDCHNTQRGKIISIFLAKAKTIFWMSQKQFEIQKNIFSYLEKTKNIVLSSVFSERDLLYMKELNNIRDKKNNNFIILESGSPIKNTEGCINYAKKNNLNFKLISGVPYFLMLRELSMSRGLIFLPEAEDTCPRIVIEAKLLECEIILNENVLHSNEKWYNDSKENIFNYLHNNVNIFWNLLKDN